MTITSPELKDFLVKCLTQGPSFHSDDLSSLVTPLEKAGILVRGQDKSSVKFSSPLAEKYYSKWLFPNRALFNPQCLHDLIKQVLSNMSASALKQSVVTETGLHSSINFGKDLHSIRGQHALFAQSSGVYFLSLSRVFRSVSMAKLIFISMGNFIGESNCL